MDLTSNFFLYVISRTQITKMEFFQQKKSSFKLYIDHIKLKSSYGRSEF